MTPKLKQILDDYCRLEYEKRGSFPYVVCLPSQLYRLIGGSSYTWNAREVRFAPLPEAAQEGIRSGTFTVPSSASADTSMSLPSGVAIAMELSAARLSQRAAEYSRCLVEGCTVCGGPRIRERDNLNGR